MAPPFHRRTCVRALILLLASGAAAKSILADRNDVEAQIRDSLRAFVTRADRPRAALQIGTPKPGLVDSGPAEGPFVRFRDDGRLIGVSVEQMRELSLKYSFEVDFFTVTGTFDEIVRDVGKGFVNVNGTARAIDVCVHQFTATVARSKTAKTARQTASPVDSRLVFLGRREKLLDNLNSAFGVFTKGLWLLVFGVLHFLAVSLASISYFQSAGDAEPQPANQETFFRMYCNHLYNLGCLLLGQLPFPPNEDTPSRVIYLVFKAFAFGLGAFYTALLVNQFQRREEEALVSMERFCNEPQRLGKALKDLHVVKDTSYQAYVVNYLRDNANDCPKVTEEERKLFTDEPGGGANLCSSVTQCRERVLDGRAYATLEDESSVDWLLNHGWCSNLQKVGQTGSPTASSWILPLDPYYIELAQPLSNAILLARDDGSFDSITKNAIEKGGEGGCKNEELDRVGVNNVKGFLIPMAAMYLFALIMQVAKWCLQ